MDDLRTAATCEPDQSAEVQRVIALAMKAIEGDVRRIAEAMVLKRDDELLGPGEFDLRNKVLGMARHMLEATVNDRKKGVSRLQHDLSAMRRKRPLRGVAETKRS